MLGESGGSACDAPAEPRTNTLVKITHLRNMTSPVNDLVLIASSKQHLRKNKFRSSDLTTRICNAQLLIRDVQGRIHDAQARISD
jgi:hypothetical protein